MRSARAKKASSGIWLWLLSEMGEAKLEPDSTSHGAGISACMEGKQWQAHNLLAGDMAERSLALAPLTLNGHQTLAPVLGPDYS